MRYNGRSPRAFRNRITRYLGVLVGAALVAALGLPSAVQAQTTGAPMVVYEKPGMPGSDAFTVSTPHGIITDGDGNVDTHWILKVDGPVSVPDKYVIDDGDISCCLHGSSQRG